MLWEDFTCVQEIPLFGVLIKLLALNEASISIVSTVEGAVISLIKNCQQENIKSSVKSDVFRRIQLVFRSYDSELTLVKPREKFLLVIMAEKGENLKYW